MSPRETAVSIANRRKHQSYPSDCPNTKFIRIVAREAIVKDCPMIDIAEEPTLDRPYLLPNMMLDSRINTGKTPEKVQKPTATHNPYKNTLASNA